MNQNSVKEFIDYIEMATSPIQAVTSNIEMLKSITGNGKALHLIDSRTVALKPNYTLYGVDREVYLYCDTVRSLPSIMKYLKIKYPKSHFSETQIIKFLNALENNKLMISDGNYYLSLAIKLPQIEKHFNKKKCA